MTGLLKNRSDTGQSKQSGFTLVELLISVAITSLVAVTVYASFRTVITSYENSDSEVRMIENARSALGDFTIHLKEIPAASTPFIEAFATDPTPINTDSLDSAAIALSIRGYSQDSIHFIAGTDVDYWYYIDTSNFELMRNTNGTVEPLAFGITQMNFLFYARDTASQEWLPGWNSTIQGLPRSIYLALTVKDESNRLNPHTYTTLVTLP